MKKKVLSSILALVMLVSLAAFTGCGKKASKDSVPTLTWYVPGDKQSDIESVISKVNEITEKKIGAKINLQFVDTGSFSEKMRMNMAAGDPFDLCFTGFVNPYNSAVSNEGLLDITDIIAKEAPELYDALPEYAWEFARNNDRIYAVPNLQIFALPVGFTVQKRYADKYDFDFGSVKCAKDIEPFLEMVKNGEGKNVIPFRNNWGVGLFYEGKYEVIQSSVAIRTDGSSNEVFFIYDTPEWKEGVLTFRDWLKKGYIRQDIVGLSDDTLDYSQGKYAVACEGYKPGVLAEVKNTIGQDVEYVAWNKPYMFRDGGAKTMIAVGRNSKNPEKAVKFISLLNTDKELYNLICFGIEGKHYTLNNENKVVLTQNSGYAPNASWKFGNQFNALVMEGQEDNVWEQTEKQNNEAVLSPLIGFNLDITPIKNEISAVSAVSSSYVLYNYTEESWEKHRKKLEDAGSEKIKKEIQRQVDEFMKNKNK